jgi:hypothetical protein
MLIYMYVNRRYEQKNYVIIYNYHDVGIYLKVTGSDQ